MITGALKNNSDQEVFDILVLTHLYETQTPWQSHPKELSQKINSLGF